MCTWVADQRDAKQCSRGRELNRGKTPRLKTNGKLGLTSMDKMLRLKMDGKLCFSNEARQR